MIKILPYSLRFYKIRTASFCKIIKSQAIWRYYNAARFLPVNWFSTERQNGFEQKVKFQANEDPNYDIWTIGVPKNPKSKSSTVVF